MEDLFETLGEMFKPEKHKHCFKACDENTRCECRENTPFYPKDKVRLTTLAQATRPDNSKAKGLTVKSLDEYKAKEELKKCPKIVRDYVKALKSVIEVKQQTFNKCLSKIKKQAQEIRELKNQEQ